MVKDLNNLNEIVCLIIILMKIGPNGQNNIGQVSPQWKWNKWWYNVKNPTSIQPNLMFRQCTCYLFASRNTWNHLMFFAEWIFVSLNLIAIIVHIIEIFFLAKHIIETSIIAIRVELGVKDWVVYMKSSV